MGSLSRNNTYVASNNLEALQYHFVTQPAGVRKVILATSKGDNLIVGVLQNKPRAGEHASVGYAGEGKITAGGSFGPEALLTCTTSGRATVAASGDVVYARALEAAIADGNVVDAIYTVAAPVRGII